ncbi:MAG: hypothetical protein CL845_06790 [Crocinitomicaceae bacterium]|nr:hypothetical protein [Crocinitomicaceae bacterium]|tara:strand:+ start:824 stop:1576 length:753 start_codon:yes stop_codon:yes gene_type:complete
MAKPNSRSTLIDYCLRALGAPVIEINLDDDQIGDRIDEALQFYQHYHADAIEKVYLKHQITQVDIDNQYIPLNDLITDVVQLFPLRDNKNTGDSMFDVRYQMHLNDVYNLGFMGSLVEYEMTQQWLSLLDMVIDNDQKHISFDRHKNQLRIDMNWSDEVKVNDYVIIECYRILNPDTYTDVYNDYFLKKYATALLKMQWGMNLLKFEGMQMPGGVTFNGRQLFDDAREEIQKLEEEVRLNWEQPVDFYTG